MPLRVCVLQVTLLALGEWVSCSGVLSSDVKAMLLKGIAQPAKGLSEQFLAALFAACANVDVRTQLADFVAPLVAVVKSSTVAQVWSLPD